MTNYRLRKVSKFKECYGGPINVHFDWTKKGVVAPLESFNPESDIRDLVLNFEKTIGYPSFFINNKKVGAWMKFGGIEKEVVIPWDAIWKIEDETFSDGIPFLYLTGQTEVKPVKDYLIKYEELKLVVDNKDPQPSETKEKPKLKLITNKPQPEPFLPGIA